MAPAVPQSKGLTYADSGVSIEEGDRFVADIVSAARRTYGPRVISGIGGFAGLFRLDYNQRLFQKNYRNPVLVACTDGVGTKVKLAFETGIHHTIGIDLVAMSVNDAVCCGAEPLFFLDYIATGKLDREVQGAVVAGIVEGCKQAECALLGGETAEHAGDFPDGHYDLAGFAVGVVEKSRIIKGSTVKPGDAVIGIPSSGLHSNGFTLARKALFEAGKYTVDSEIADLGRPLGEELLTPTRIYVRPLLSLIQHYKRRKIPAAIAHITGGGIVGNLPRVLPPGMRAVIDPAMWTPPPIFDVIRKAGKIAREEMWRVFNMGIGLCAVIPPYFLESALRQLAEAGMPDAIPIGFIEEHGFNESMVVLSKGAL